MPAPFLDIWKKFIDLLQRSDRTSANFDQIIPQLLPMFNCSTFKLPFRLLNIHEVLQLSGLANHWTMTDLDDAAGRFNVPWMMSEGCQSFDVLSLSMCTKP